VRFARRHREYLPVCLFAALVAAAMWLPYARAYANEWHGWRFTGILSRHFADAASHLSWARQAQDGEWLFESKYAGADAGRRRLFNLLFLAMGKAARWTGASLPVVFHVERTISAVLVLVLVYWFAAPFFADRGMRWTALLLVTTSAGLYWIDALRRYGEWSGDQKLVEAITFRSLEWEVVVGPATALVLLTLGLAQRAVMQRDSAFRIPHTAFGLALAALGMAAVHPHDVPTVGLVLAVFATVRVMTASREARRPEARRCAVVLAAFALGAAPLMAYHWTTLVADPSYWSYGAHTHEYYTQRWLMDFGLVLVAAVVGGVAVVTGRERGLALLVVWPAVLALVMATSFPPIQRAHLFDGLHTVLCVLAVCGLWVGLPIGSEAGIQNPRSGIHVLGLALFIAAASVGNVLKFAEELRWRVPHHDQFIRAEEMEAMDWLAAHARKTDVIACLAEVGAGVPMWSGCRVYVGHPEITPDYDVRRHEMELLMGKQVGREPRPLDPNGVAVILQKSRADYIYIEERALALSAAETARVLLANGLAERVFANKRVAIYRVTHDRLARKKVSGTFSEKGS
jgi:hypothetical protein